jgi:GAF domain-containing protein
MAEEQSNSHDPLAQSLRRLVRAVETSGRAILPVSNEELLQTIVEAAARLFGAAAASIALVDEPAQEIVFRVAYGAGRDEVIGMRIPLDQGIAGYVVNTGQPLAISNVQQDTRFARSAAEKTGYVPRSILAMPLLSGDRVIGVIEVLDKIQAASFGMQDMELLGLFARQAAMAIHASQQFEHVGTSLIQGIRELVGDEDKVVLADALHDDHPAETDLTELADLFNLISQLGDAERTMGLDILRALAEYARTKNMTGGGK